MTPVLECVVNLSEGRNRALLDELTAAAGHQLLDRHADADHGRSVFTLGGARTEEATRVLADLAVQRLDIHRCSGVHPRLGVVDVVPFVPLDARGAPADVDADLTEAVEARRHFAEWAAEELALPCFFYGPERSLPELRRRAFADLQPDTGPDHPHPTAGACAVGARPALVAYNLWLDCTDLSVARKVAAEIRSDDVRALGLAVTGAVQVSCNLLAPLRTGPAQVYRAVSQAAGRRGVAVGRAELVGLAPAAVVRAVPEDLRVTLDMDVARTVEARLAAAGQL